VDNQLIDEALGLYNYLRLHVYKEIIYTDDRERVDKLVLRAFYRFERRKLYFTRSRIAFFQKAGSVKLTKYQGRACALYGCYSGNLR